MRRLAFVVALSALAGAAVADDGADDYDPVVLESCLDTRPLSDRDSCIGMGATRCLYGPVGSSTVGTNFCLNSEYEQWDGLLNSTYAALVAFDKAADTELGDQFPGVPRLEPSLRDMQRAWIAFRDASCMYEVAQWGGGTGGGPAYTACMMELTARQVLVLQARVAEYQATDQ